MEPDELFDEKPEVKYLVTQSLLMRDHKACFETDTYSEPMSCSLADGSDALLSERPLGLF